MWVIPRKYRIVKRVKMDTYGLPVDHWCLEVKVRFWGWNHLYGFVNEENALEAKKVWEEI